MKNLIFRMSGYQPPSTNDMYIPSSGKMKSSKAGRIYSKSYFRKSAWLNEWQAKVARMFSSEYFYTNEELEAFKEYIGKTGAMKLELDISMPLANYGASNLKANDASNFIKAIEDSLATGIGIDDRHNLVVSVSKYYNTTNNWYIKAEFSKIGEAWDEKFMLNEFKEEKVYDFQK